MSRLRSASDEYRPLIADFGIGAVVAKLQADHITTRPTALPSLSYAWEATPTQARRP